MTPQPPEEDRVLLPPEVLDVPARQTAIIHLTVPRERIQEVMGPAIGEVMATLAAQGIPPAGPVFSYHLRTDPALFDFEVGVPVERPVLASGRVVPSRLPAARVARAVYQGPYEGLGPAWGELGSWLAAHDHTPATELWESYVRGPESSPDASQWRTELNRPLLSSR